MQGFYKSTYNSCITQEMLIALAGKWVWAKWRLPPPCLVPCEHHQPWSHDLATQLPIRRPHIYCVWHATHLCEDAWKPSSRATCVHQNYVRRSISHHIYYTKMLIIKPKQHIHVPLEIAWGITKSKWHDVPLRCPIAASECSLLWITCCHGDLMIPIM